ncbi:sirohydrochlorin chelatase [Texcoconibacillus texcoconensis]|uniref:Sirohydrochlorin ferrochelatase n=1 Tax=Texcoconibacillus texcoconensis TaxID=1095777 RepID=A0A840QLV6_9BACI|nr:CbiX/SirB N-terminal domain-containing protein [Texcoconibacillus texcoconensis]MBB5172336.1 sirohydrochlorin ferrochelatase [Texcoconibacillus texcoconensis]
MHNKESDQHIGVLVIAHGSKNKQWVQRIKDAVSKVEADCPLTVAYLEFVEGETIADGVRWLERQSVQKIIVIPLFVCSGSSHLEEIQYALGIKSDLSSPTDIERIDTHAEIIWRPAMDDHPLIVEIIKKRVQQLSTDPENEVLLLVAHGSKERRLASIWERKIESIEQTLNESMPFSKVSHAMLLPDRDMLNEKAQAVENRKRLIVIPLFLSEGYFTLNVIPKQMEGLAYAWDGKTYLPHDLVSRWIESQIQV